MRTPRLFLGIFALALRLPLLLLACGGSGELTGGRSSRRATAGPTTEVAEPSPTPRATARPPLVQTSPETDREALVALYNATGGPNWRRNNNWLSDVPIGEWEGVTTDGNGRVIGLALSDNQLSGEIPPELGNLANLTGLDLDGNELSGEIPPELGGLANLTELYISGSQLSGEIPPELGGLANPPELTRLALSRNQLRGEIPPELGNLATLQGLDLGYNQLSGEIPPELDNLAFLAEGGPDEAVPGVTQHHDQGPRRAATARLRVLDQTQTAEVQLRHLSRRGVLHPDRAPAPAPPVAASDEPVQGRVGHLTPSGCQQLLNSGELQALDVEPPVDLVCPRAQQFLAGRLRLPRAGTADAGQPAELVLGGGRTLLDHAGLLRRRQVLPDRVPGQASPRGYVALAVPSLPAPYDFCDFHSEHLPVRHHHSSLRSVAMVADKAPKGGLMTLVNWTDDPG